jgi:DNA-directed RNA polymerase specialized sigma24 family protein
MFVTALPFALGFAPGSLADAVPRPPWCGSVALGTVTGESKANTTADEVARAVSGDEVAARRVLGAIVPVIRVRVARVLFRYRALSRRRDLSQEADDLTQEVLTYLFENGGRVLRTWDPAKGLELTGFVGMVAERAAASILKSGARTPWREDPVDSEVLAAAHAPEVSPADAMLSRELGERVYLALRAELSPLGAQLFQQIFVDEMDVEAICRHHSMSKDAVYAWRSRLTRRVRELVAREGDVPSHARSSS